MLLDSRRFDLNQYPRFESVPKNKVRSGSAGILPCEQNLIPQARGNEIGLPALQLIRSSQENDMGDDMSERDFRDRVSAGDDYEIEYFAQQNGVSADQVRQLIKGNGNNRAALTEAARRCVSGNEKQRGHRLQG
ncbi:DUF3606 domain-containing protein [Mesorhizobium sp.]|uniref:DUF3606 domain-containing protein n=1 Tax=Mesorhizobium sp. TaxID=1871066 RepID=UPI00257CD627|nr:DUF3606 domain-containing protein [Mesorhizobium sp.]